MQTMDTYGLGVAATFNESKQQQVVTEKNLLLRIDRVGQNSQVRKIKEGFPFVTICQCPS